MGDPDMPRVLEISMTRSIADVTDLGIPAEITLDQSRARGQFARYLDTHWSPDCQILSPAAQFNSRWLDFELPES